MSSKRFALAVVLALTACIGTAHAGSKQRPTLPRKSSDARVAVAIYEFTSNLPEISPRGATEQFKTALVQSGQFRVVERAKLDRGVVREKQMNAAGQTTGSSSQQQLRGAEYIFEAEITELGSGTRTSSNGVNIGGLQIGGASNRDEFGIDVSIVDANTGDVVDAISVRKRLKGAARSVGRRRRAHQPRPRRERQGRRGVQPRSAAPVHQQGQLRRGAAQGHRRSRTRTGEAFRHQRRRQQVIRSHDHAHP